MALALQHGAGVIDPVEVNPQTIGFAKSLESWTGGVLSNPRVNLHINEARRFTTQHEQRWDHINLTLLQTSPSTSRGFSHVDARVLTREAIRTYLQHLNPGGVLAIIQNSPLLAERTRTTAASVIDSNDQVLEWQLPTEDHADNPFNHLILVRNETFTALEIEQLNIVASSIGVEQKSTGQSENTPITTDDQPFLFE